MSRERPNTDHSFFHEIIDDIRRLVVEYELEAQLHLRANVTVVRRARDDDARDGAVCVGGWRSRGADTSPERFALTAHRLALLCTNRRLGPPRQLTFEGERSFGGPVVRGLSGDNVGLPWANARVVIIGHGPYAIEQCRTALEHGAAHVTFLVRRHGLVCPAILDYVNLVRPFTADFDHHKQGSGMVIAQWQRAYQAAGASPPECWRKGRFRPDGHSVSVSDMYFLAHHLGLVHSEVALTRRFRPDGIETDRGSFHLADIVCKCVGFEVNEGNERLFGRAWMGADGMVGRGTWVMVEPYLDTRASGLPLIGHVNGVNWAAKMITRFWRQGGVPVASVMTPGTTLQRVRINHVSASDATDALLQAAASDPEIRAELRSHVQSVTEACHAGWRAEEYLECNRRQWFELQRQLLSSRACHSAPGAVPSIPYPFEDALRVLDLEVAHMMQPPERPTRDSLITTPRPTRESRGGICPRTTLSTTPPNAPWRADADLEVADADLEGAVLRIVRRLCRRFGSAAAGTPLVESAISADTPLVEAGIDSLASIELSSRLQALASSPSARLQALALTTALPPTTALTPTTALPPTILFEYPTAASLASLLVRMRRDERNARAGRTPDGPSEGAGGRGEGGGGGWSAVMSSGSSSSMSAVLSGGGGRVVGSSSRGGGSSARVADCLVCVTPHLVGSDRPPLIGAPMLLGTGAVFAALVPLIPTTAVYYCEHNTLYTGGAPESYAQSLSELARLYAEAIKQACCRAGAVAGGQPSVDPFLDHLTGAVPGAHGEGYFDLIGGSWGGYMAHQIALVAQQIGAPCRRLVLLDPNPPTVGRAPSLAPSTAREAVHALLATMLDAAAAGAQDGAQDGAQVGARLGARYGAWRQPPEGDDGGGGVRSTFDALADEIAIWPDAELIPRAAQRLVGAGLMADTIEAVVALGRRVLVYQHQDLMMRQHLARAFEEGTPLPQLDCPTLLVLATTRADFFERAFALGTTRETAGMERAREFGAVRRELVLEGTHQSVVQRCATGTERRFVHALLEFLAASGFEA